MSSGASGIADPASYRALIRQPEAHHIDVIDQRALPHTLRTVRIASADDAARAIRDMWIRGAPLIGAVGAYGLALALDRNASDAALAKAHAMLNATRPTAVNLDWALTRVRRCVETLPAAARADAAWHEADRIMHEDAAINHALGAWGVTLLRAIAGQRPGPVRVMTHCNAGALATCGFGTATAPLFLAHAQGIALHVFVSETRPRLQGANLTAWEMRERGIAHTLFADSASGLLMRRGDIDIVFVGADRVARNGDVCNKLGTYDKALAAHDKRVPFYGALPSPTWDPSLATGDGIPIETRNEDEVLNIAGRDASGAITAVAIAPPGTQALNPAFDVTPARLITGLITERGIASASQGGMAGLFPERV
jgi:methylthioribose-1-phosphate isomerase